MSKTDYPGIDYSLHDGSNVDSKTGIHYGVISQGSIMQSAFDEFESDYGDPTCGECGNKAIETNDPEIYACLTCERTFDSDDAYVDGAIGMNYQEHGYKLSQCLDNDLFVLQSPYYTHAQYCSPCAPGAGNLDSECDSGPKTYCLSHDWFDGGIAPYTVYLVADDSIVEPDPIDIENARNRADKDTD